MNYETIAQAIRAASYMIAIPGLIVRAMLMYNRKLYYDFAIYVAMSGFMLMLAVTVVSKLLEASNSDAVSLFSTLAIASVAALIFFSVAQDIRKGVKRGRDESEARTPKEE